jgi:hypothetical protein
MDNNRKKTTAANSGLASVCRLTFILPALRSGENQGRQTERQAAKRYRQRLIQKKFTHPHFVAYICKRPKEDVRLQHVLVIKTLW